MYAMSAHMADGMISRGTGHRKEILSLFVVRFIATDNME